MIREVGRDPSFCSKQDWFYALALVLHGPANYFSHGKLIAWARNRAGRRGRK
jgi:hypothetical protein